MRHRVQADLPGGPGGRRTGHVRPGRRHPAVEPAQRQHHRPADEEVGTVGPADAGMGHHGEHELDRHRGQVRACLAAVHRHVRGGVQDRRDHGLTNGVA